VSDEWLFPVSFKFDLGRTIETNESWPVKVYGEVITQGQRSKKNKKGENVFDCNSYQILDMRGKIHYFLEDELR
jgi:hypothetical protein